MGATTFFVPLLSKDMKYRIIAKNSLPFFWKICSFPPILPTPQLTKLLLAAHKVGMTELCNFFNLRNLQLLQQEDSYYERDKTQVKKMVPTLILGWDQ